MSNTRHVVFDLETYSTRKNAVVLSMGVAVFTWPQLHEFEHYRDTGLLLKLDVSAQAKRHIELETMNWWNEIPCDRAKEASLHDIPAGLLPKYFFQALRSWASVQNFGPETLWYCRGPHFDAAILEDFAADYDAILPFNFWNVRDVRTVLDFYQKEKLDAPDTMVPHNPLDDAAWDAYQMVYWSNQ